MAKKKATTKEKASEFIIFEDLVGKTISKVDAYDHKIQITFEDKLTIRFESEDCIQAFAVTTKMIPQEFVQPIGLQVIENLV